MQEKCLSVVVPVYNEQETLERIIGKLVGLPRLLEIIVVDDCSTDATPEILKRLQEQWPQVKSFRHEKNAGKTEALKTGFRSTTGEIVIVQDADLEYDPDEIPFVIAPILRGSADVVFGSRFLVRKETRVLYFRHYLGNKLITFFCNVVTDINLSDVETCYKAFYGDIIRNMIITSTGFGFEVEVAVKVAKLRCAIYETPISYYGRTYEEGKKITVWDGVAAFYYIVRYSLFTSLKKSFVTTPKFNHLPAPADHH